MVPRATYEFQVGVSDVIAGWRLGVVGMCVGDTRRLTVPPQLGYGQEGVGPIIPGDERSDNSSHLISHLLDS